jgi:hypothetical protein
MDLFVYVLVAALYLYAGLAIVNNTQRPRIIYCTNSRTGNKIIVSSYVLCVLLWPWALLGGHLNR